jgi:hypothetical protein
MNPEQQGPPNEKGTTIIARTAIHAVPVATDPWVIAGTLLAGIAAIGAVAFFFQWRWDARKRRNDDVTARARHDELLAAQARIEAHLGP